ncbi:myosin-IIIb-like isoform X1 [Mytilus edulis]|uniref:myosin-IIIb-like isoform X1 n=1 Tax=Mytilus edulis TaxID=6550 RepID=UPI0039F09C79
MDRPEPGSVEDLATLAKLDDSILLDELRVRYNKNLIYTYVGDILIAVNPFRDLDIYGTEESQKYYLEKKSSNPPHIFAISDAAYQCITGYGGRTPTNQCILISGESGAGKTESTKLIIKQLIELCRSNTQLEQQILQVNPLLEAFGNAQTSMNNNSSRFGKYIQLAFRNGHVIGAKISEYLLERSRLVRQNPGEENFHIFYYMFAGLTTEYQQRFHLQKPENYRYLSNGASCLKNEKKSLKGNYEDLRNSLDLVGFTDEEQENMFNMIAAVLNLGNVQFGMDDDEASFVEDDNSFIKVASALLGIPTEEVAGTLTSIVTYTRGEEVKRNYTQQQAQDARDAIAKAIYGRMFGWIVNKINQLLAPPEYTEQGDRREIGILDIFGFEHFEKNSFEQACINLANEQLQFFFNQHVFRLEQEEYTKEGIDWKEIKFVDNQPLLDLFLAKPIGILSLLDEESQFPKATDATFVDKLNKHFGKNSYYGKSQQTKSSKFTISHYAGKVTYDASEWLEKNRDSLPAGLQEMLQGSTNDLAKLIFRAQITRTGTLALQSRKSRHTRKSKRPSVDGGRKRKQTVGGQFKNSLQILMERMTSATPIFVRCLKPNHVKSPGKFDSDYIKQQLLYTGMLETTKIRREGFAVRPTFPEFVDKYKIIVCKASLPGTKENCLTILKASKITGWQLGKTKVFLKYYHIEQLADIFKLMGKSAVLLQKLVRGFLGRCEYKRCLARARQEAMRVQHLLESIQNLSIDLSNHQQVALLNDQKIPKAFFGKYDESDQPPYIPSFNSDVISIQPSMRSYEQPAKAPTTSREMGTQASSSESEFSDDEFKPISSTNYGPPGTKHATIRWFKETQTQQVYDPVNTDGNFIAEWFHGVISRKASERLLKSKSVGCYLVRVSESRFGYTLSFRAKDRSRHYMIDQLANKKFIIIGEPKVHRTLKDLVEYHKKNKLSNWDGFLQVPCGQEHGECDYQDLMGENFYFTLEEEQKKPVYTRQRQSAAIKGNRISRNVPSHAEGKRISQPVAPSVDKIPPRQSQLIPTPDKVPLRQSQAAPPIPQRNYTQSQNHDRQSQVSGRPLPKRPDEAYQRLLQNQNEQHGYH